MQRKLDILKALANRYQLQRDECMISINLLLNASEYPEDILDKIDSKVENLSRIEDKIQLINHFIVQMQANNLEKILSDNMENKSQQSEK